MVRHRAACIGDGSWNSLSSILGWTCTTPGRPYQGGQRRMLIEAAWSYRFSARISREQLLRQERLAKPIRDIAWKAQERLCRRYRAFARAGKRPTVITAAIARELAGFIWAIAKQVHAAAS